jgi:septal ring factor EnvC (AmiA/AmiB activator)
MKELVYLLAFITFALNINAQNVTMSNNSEVIKVYKGNVVKIDVDTAYVIGKIKAEFLNQKIKELNEIKLIYNDLADNHNKLLDNLNKVQELLENFKKKIATDSMTISENFNRILKDLDKSIIDLKNNNELLKKNNSDLLTQIKQLDHIVKELKKQTRWIWWNGVADKLVSFAGGVGVGILLVKIL